jgi:hypothetical protein
MSSVCVNEALTDDELRWVLSRLDSDKDKEVFGLVCKRWLNLQSTDRKKLAARAGPHMLRRLASRFTQIVELDLSQSISRSFYPGVTDSDLAVISEGFKFLRVLNLHNCKGIYFFGLNNRKSSLFVFFPISLGSISDLMKLEFEGLFSKRVQVLNFVLWCFKFFAYFNVVWISPFVGDFCCNPSALRGFSLRAS